ncbi:MAG: RNA polymerase Rpb4 family protein [Candidatus Hadarchaeota archaeon]
MVGKQVTAEKPVSLAEVLETLEKEKKKGDLDYTQRLAYDYAQKFAKLESKKAGEMVEELLKLGNLKDHQVVSIVNIMPETKEDLELLFLKERTKLEEGDVKKILEIVEKYGK